MTNSNVLRLIHAGALQQVMERCLDLFTKQNPDLKTEMNGVGSREGAKRLLSGEHYDVIALADQGLFAELLVPEMVENYFVFAADQIVIAYTGVSKGSKEITPDNWINILLDPRVRFCHSDYHLDPCGYRALMVWQLAEKFYDRSGLFLELEGSCSPFGAYPKSFNLASDLIKGKLDYAFLYSSQAKQLELPYISLPSKINLSNPAYANYYDQAAVSVESKIPGNNIIIHGKPIEFAIGKSRNSQLSEPAQAFIDLLTGPDGDLILEECGLIPC